MRVHEIERTKASLTYVLLKDFIRNLEIKTGSHLDVEGIAKRFNSSVTPVREALFRLSCESLIEAQPNRGYFVKRIDLAEQVSLHEIGDLILTHSSCHIHEWPIAFQKSDITAHHYAEFLEAIAINARNPEMHKIFLNVIDRTFGLIKIYLEREEARTAVAGDISNFLNAHSSPSAYDHLRKLRQRFHTELPRLVKEASTVTGGAVGRLPDALRRMEQIQFRS